jgi:hypothetical protein
MTFKDFLKKEYLKKKRKKKQQSTLPQSPGSRLRDTANMTSPTVLPGSGECPQPSL